ncbi:hypothetical protein BT96DRAFT_1012111 [Gymnopus androsaceus JB14]|uniref:Uncharacterized protein n=1 Tax=Gymnopus androsaceus JB14 TaxID=1447944 RepID=A0A6A4IJ22_9AGAR|nr:hypothetical protein BT96DRAFT_1012111 [Gymnopus androsaceus JB14]
MLASPQPHGIHPPSSFMNTSTSNLSLKSSKSRKHSVTLSNTMGWLSRHSTQSSVSSFYKGNKSSPPPEPERKPVRSIELVSSVRTGPLGSGATIVRTPEEALQNSGLSFPMERKPSLHRSSTSTSSRSNLRPAIQRSASSASKLLSSAGSDEDELAGISWPTPPSHTSPLPSQRSLRPSLKAKSQSSIDVFRVPALPAHLAQSPPQPPFEPVLISGVPSDTCIFCNYLRSPVGTADVAETLPRAAQLQPANSQSRLEALLELRDEAAHLQLDDLYKLCSDEIRQRQPALQPRLPRTHSRGTSSNSSSTSNNVESYSQHTSVSSMHTLLDRSAHRARDLSMISDDRESTKASIECSPDFAPNNARLRSPPTPESWKEGGRHSGSGSSTRSRHRIDLQSPPTGWI